MTTLFYLLCILFIGYEISIVIKAEKYCEFKDKLTQYNNGDTVNTRFLIKAFLLAAFSIFYMAWAIIGLFSSLKIYFFSLFILSLLSMVATKYAFKNYENLIKRIDAVISVLILLEIFTKHFY